MRRAWRVAWYRFRATFGRRIGGYVAIVLLIGLTGGIALASIAGARRTQSSYPKFLASTDPSDLTVSAFGRRGQPRAAFTKAIAHLAGVKQVATVAVPTDRSGEHFQRRAGSERDGERVHGRQHRR